MEDLIMQEMGFRTSDEKQEKKTLKVEEFLDNKREYLEIRTEEFVKSLIELEFQKKEIDREIATIKQMAKEDGVAVEKVSKIYSRIKSRLRSKPEDIHEEDLLEEKILSNEELVGDIAALVRPIPKD